jgi:hypothetical protein
MPTTRIISNPEGKPIAVEIPYRQWLKIQKDLRYVQELRAVKADITEALAEVQAHKQGKILLPTLSEFLEK